MPKYKYRIDKLKQDSFEGNFLKIAICFTSMVDAFMFGLISLLTCSCTSILLASVLFGISSLIAMLVFLRRLLKAGVD